MVDDDEPRNPNPLQARADARRHLLGLRDPVEIVRRAIEDPSYFEDAVAALAHCEPNALAARTLVDAHDANEVPSWLVACLLGHVGHRDGYSRVIDILRRGDRSLSESYAAEAAVRIADTSIAGVDVQADLEDVIDSIEDGTTRKAAAWALGALGTARAIAFLTAAPARGRLHARTVAKVLSRAAVDPEIMLDATRSSHPDTRRWPAMLIAERVRRRGDLDSAGPARAPLENQELRRCAQSPSLRAALGEQLAKGEDTVWSADAKLVRAWLDAG